MAVYTFNRRDQYSSPIKISEVIWQRAPPPGPSDWKELIIKPFAIAVCASIWHQAVAKLSAASSLSHSIKQLRGWAGVGGWVHRCRRGAQKAPLVAWTPGGWQPAGRLASWVQ